MRIFEPKKEEEAGGWRKLHNEELRNLYASQTITGGSQVKEDEMDWACSTRRRNFIYIYTHTKLCSEDLKGRDHTNKTGAYEKIILGWIIRK
jgi:hypothetical protein